ncbi:MAG: O-antigen ligase domain-containing protein [Planctomycetota bacterium]
MITPLAMYGWLPVVLGLFLIMPPKRAVLWSFFVAWLFLPMAKYEIPKLPDYTKMSATCFGVMLGIVIFDFGRLTMFKFKLIDLPIVFFCIVAPIATALSNRPDLKLYDGLSEVMALSTAWLLPYLIGRLYFTDLKDMRTLALCFLAGALAYVPICWFEARFSPQLHRLIYGFHQHHFVHADRGGFLFSFRPRGFMQSGLMTATWICSAALIAWCFWTARTKIQFARWTVPAIAVLCVLGMTALIAKGMGALILGFGGFAVLLLTRHINTRVFMIALLAVAPMFALTRAQDVWNGDTAIAYIQAINPDRAWSLQYRFDNDAVLVKKAMQRPVFGWGGYGRSLVRSQDGERTAITDGMWILLLGKFGFAGLFAFMLALAMPTILFVIRYPPKMWLSSSVAPAAGLATVLAIYQVDCLFNAMENPLFFLIGGGMCSAMTSAMVVARRSKVAAERTPIDPSGQAAPSPSGSPGFGTPVSPARSETRPA